MGLREEIEIQSKAISTDSYQMSIGELINYIMMAKLTFIQSFSVCIDGTKLNV